ncbi:MAG: 4-fold beta flower protein [Gammaproteobacteria bacterium]
MEPIFDKNGRVMAWLNDKNIYHLNGQHLGIFDGGVYRDHRGGVVAFIRGGSGGPVFPVPSVPPVPPVPSVPPVPAVPSVPPAPSVPSLGWGIDWGQFINY